MGKKHKTFILFSVCTMFFILRARTFIIILKGLSQMKYTFAPITNNMFCLFMSSANFFCYDIVVFNKSTEL